MNRVLRDIFRDLEPDFFEEELTPVGAGEIPKAPFRWICAIEVNHGRRVLPVPAQKLSPDPHDDLLGPTVKGSGLLISPRHVLTCGHILTGRTPRAPSDPVPKINVVPGTFRSTGGSLSGQPRFGVWSARQFWFHPRLLVANAWESRSFDFGLIELNSDSGTHLGDKRVDGESFGWWGRTAPNFFMNTHRPPGWLRTRKVNVYGFPKASAGKNSQLHWGFVKVSAVLDRDLSSRRLHPILRYDVRTVGGISGGPVWTRDETPPERRLVAIHGGQDGATGRSYGLLLNPVVTAFLRKQGVNNPALDAADRPY